ncbi:MAG: hypothetical protein JSW27_14270, partial [Phycisphaerales bacterium]
TLNVYANGFQSRQTAITVTDENTSEMDLGSITLRPQDPAQPEPIHGSPNANWQEDFDRTYRLDDSEVFKLIKPPFSLARQDYMIDSTHDSGQSADMLDPEYAVYHQYRWDGHLEDGWWYAHHSGHMALHRVMHTFLDIPSYEFELPEELAHTHVARGDWIVRKDATTEEKILALEEIIHAELQRPIHFEKRQVKRDTIVVTGRYAFAPLPGADPNRLYVMVDEIERLGNDEAESLPRLLTWLANGIKIAVDDQTEPTENRKILFSHDLDLLNPPLVVNPIDREKTLPLLLDNLARQTGLTFKVEKRPADVWFITEEKEETAMAAEQP